MDATPTSRALGAEGSRQDLRTIGMTPSVALAAAPGSSRPRARPEPDRSGGAPPAPARYTRAGERRGRMWADPFQGDVFVFRPRRADRVKILVYDGTGLVLYSKRLEAGRFSWPSPAEGVVRLTSAQLTNLLEGLPWHRLQPRAIPRPSTAW